MASVDTAATWPLSADVFDHRVRFDGAVIDGAVIEADDIVLTLSVGSEPRDLRVHWPYPITDEG